jgi:hypothetical protein
VAPVPELGAQTRLRLSPDLLSRVEQTLSDARIQRENEQRQLSRLERAGMHPLQIPRLFGEVSDLGALERLGALLEAA